MDIKNDTKLNLVDQENPTTENLSAFPKNYSKPVDKSLRIDPVAVIKSLTHAEKGILDYFIRMRAYHSNIVVGHNHITQIVKNYHSGAPICRRTVLRCLKKLRLLGLIDWITPKLSWYKELANIYWVNPFVDNLTFRAKCGRLLGGLRLLSLALLASMPQYGNTLSVENVTALSQKDFYINIQTVERLSIVNSRRPRWVRFSRIRYSKVKKGTTKRERYMEAEKSESAASAVKNIKLTSMGKFSLSAFPPAAIQYADLMMGMASVQIRDAYGFFKGLCITWCKDHGLRPEYSHIDEFKLSNPECVDFPLVEGDGLVKQCVPRDEEAQPYQRHNKFSGKPQSEKPVNRTSAFSIYTPVSKPKEEMNNKQIEVQKAIQEIKSSGKPMNAFTTSLVGILGGTERYGAIPVAPSNELKPFNWNTVGELMSRYDILKKNHDVYIENTRIDNPTVLTENEAVQDTNDEECPIIPRNLYDDETRQEIFE